MTDKQQRGAKPHCAQHEKDAIANTGHVPEEERDLHKAIHV